MSKKKEIIDHHMDTLGRVINTLILHESIHLRPDQVVTVMFTEICETLLTHANFKVDDPKEGLTKMLHGCFDFAQKRVNKENNKGDK